MFKLFRAYSLIRHTQHENLQVREYVWHHSQRQRIVLSDLSSSLSTPQTILILVIGVQQFKKANPFLLQLKHQII
ncbi:MAG: hypothetical protein RIR39_2643 [Pseudomonadota bacterium]|jgi:hypothetical protein